MYNSYKIELTNWSGYTRRPIVRTWVTVKFLKWLGDNWGTIYSHPSDYTHAGDMLLVTRKGLIKKAMKGVNMFLLLLLLATALQAQNEKGKTRTSVKTSFTDLIPSSKIIEWRRHIHENPELSFKEVNTSQYVEDLLKTFGNIQVIRPTSTSVLGILKGAKQGKTVAFRADMDALPVQEETELFGTKPSTSVRYLIILG